MQSRRYGYPEQSNKNKWLHVEHQIHHKLSRWKSHRHLNVQFSVFAFLPDAFFFPHSYEISLIRVDISEQVLTALTRATGVTNVATYCLWHELHLNTILSRSESFTHKKNRHLSLLFYIDCFSFCSRLWKYFHIIKPLPCLWSYVPRNAFRKDTKKNIWRYFLEINFVYFLANIFFQYTFESDLSAIRKHSWKDDMNIVLSNDFCKMFKEFHSRNIPGNVLIQSWYISWILRGLSPLQTESGGGGGGGTVTGQAAELEQ